MKRAETNRVDPRGKIDVTLAKDRTRSVASNGAASCAGSPLAAYDSSARAPKSLAGLHQKINHPTLRGRTESSFSNKSHTPYPSRNLFCRHLRSKKAPRN